MSTSTPRVLYIAGFGRSGSTFLDIVLGSQPGVFSAGELVSLFAELVEDRPCSCGERLRVCPLWRDVLKGVRSKLDPITYERARDVTRSMDHVLPRAPREPRTYGKLWSTVFHEIHRATGCDLIVDSSKTMRGASLRPRALTTVVGLDVRVVHLVRDPRAVVFSAMRGWRRVRPGRWSEILGPDSRAGLAVRGIGGWLHANLRVRDPALIVRYEDLVDGPGEQLRRIGEAIDLDLSRAAEIVAAGTSISSGHGVAGNRLRRSENIVLKPDLEWATRMPRSARAIAAAGAPLARRYGYR